MTTAVIDVGLGNVGSVANMLTKVGSAVELTSDPSVVQRCSRIVLPGVGSFDTATERLSRSGLTSAIKNCASDGKPILGICLGLQLMADSSEEGVSDGLGLIPGRVTRLPARGPAGKLRVPHMGWAHLKLHTPNPVFASVVPDSRFYFVHSYALEPDDSSAVLALASYQGVEFCASAGAENVLGVQFHPEKSHRHGMAVLRDFVDLT